MFNDTKRSVTLIGVPKHNSCMGTAKKTDEAIRAGERLKAVLRMKQIDRKELAELTGIGYSTLGNYEQGTRELPIREAQIIERATGYPAAYLLGLIDELDMEVLMAPREARAGLVATIKAIKAPVPNAERHPSKQPIKKRERPFDKDAGETIKAVRAKSSRIQTY